MRAIGLMSGTSLDGMDAALVEVRRVGTRDSYRARLRAFVTHPYPPAMRSRLAAAAGGVRWTAGQFAILDAAFVESAVAAVRVLCRRAGVPAHSVRVIGSHGQTIFHGPAAGGERVTWQIGSPARIAALTGIPTVGDFRTADLCAGGEGAPLMPIVHRMLFAHRRRRRAIQNIGGIGNVTWLSAGAEELLAFDTGPGMMLIDETVRRATGGRQLFDRGGRLAARGSVDRRLLEWLLDDGYLARTPPKSTGRERYGADLARRFAERARRAGLSAEDRVATATAFTAASIADQYARFLAERIDEVFVCGGGRRNPTLVRMLRHLLGTIPVSSVEELGWNADALEAVGFALLAVAALDGVRFDLQSVTGSSSRVALGVLAPAGGR